MNYNKLEQEALLNNEKLRKEQIEISNKINLLSQRFNDTCNEIKENNKIIMRKDDKPTDEEITTSISQR